MKAASPQLERSRNKKKASKGSGWVTYLIGIFILSLMFPFGWLLREVSGQSNWLPVSLHSILTANYSADPLAFHLPQIQFGLIEDVLNDSTTLTPGIFATLEGNLTTPVPTVTPKPGELTSTLPASTLPPASPTPRPGLDATPTSLPASMTPPASQVPSVTPTSPIIYSQTPTPPTLPPIQSITPTLQPTDTPRSTPTDTVRPPTSTLPPPTATPPPLPTRTPNPYPGPTIPPYP